MNITLDQFYGSIDDNVQKRRDFSLRKNDRVSGVGDLFEIVENETPLIVGENIAKENGLLKHREERHVLILPTDRLFRKNSHKRYLR